MADCFTEQILPIEYMGDSLHKINDNFINLQNVACKLSSTVANVVSFGVTGVTGTINLKQSVTIGSDHLLEQQPVPPWHIGLTNKPLHLETGGNKISQQNNKDDQYQEAVSRVQKHNFVYLKSVTKAISTPNGFSGVNGYKKGVMLFDGRVLHIPYSNTAAAKIYNYKNNTLQTLTGFITVNQGYHGGVLLSNGKVFCIPHNSTNATIYTHNETPANIFTTINTGGSYPGGGAFIGGTLLPDGRVFLAPSASTSYIIYDPVTGTKTTTAVSPPLGGTTNNFFGCILSSDGASVYLIPRNSTSMYAINISTGLGAALIGGLPGGDAYRGGVRLSTGSIFLVPHNATSAVIYDPVLNFHTTTPSVFPGSGAYETGTLLPDGRVFLCPANATKPAIFNPFDNSLEDVEITVTPGDYNGSVLLPNGRVYLMPQNATSGLIITVPHYKNFTLNTLTGPQFNKL
jgi:hypothetical protein